NMRRSKKDSAMSSCTAPIIRILVLLVVFSLGAVFAQGTNARLSGTIFDSSGAVIKGSTVTLQNIETGIVLSTSSNEAGIYEFPSIQPGPYKLKAQSSGFQDQIYEPLTLQVAGQVQRDVTMAVAPLPVSIQVIPPDLESPVAGTT